MCGRYAGRYWVAVDSRRGLDEIGKREEEDRGQ